MSDPETIHWGDGRVSTQKRNARRADGHGMAWKGGRHLNGGYVMLYLPDHPHARKRGYVAEHLVVASAALGRPLPKGAQVHHVDGDTTNNAPSNLVICQDLGYHKLLHQRQRALDACGNPNARRCTFCRSYDRQGDLVFTTRLRRGKAFEHGHHPDCRQLYRRERRRQGHANS